MGKSIASKEKKLTLKFDAHIIEMAKEYARSNNTSLSKLIERLLSATLSKQEKKSSNDEITPLVQSFLKKKPIHKTDQELKEEYSDYLLKKYK